MDEDTSHYVAIGAICLAVLGVIIVAIWGIAWYLRGQAIDNTYKQDTHSQQYQAGVIAQERDYADGYQSSDDSAQKKQISIEFCAMYSDLEQPIPADLVAAHSTICH